MRMRSLLHLFLVSGFQSAEKAPEKREATVHLSPGQRIPNVEVAEMPPHSPPSDAEVCFSVLSRRNEEKEEDHN
jgi:hypothetical protein